MNSYQTDSLALAPYLYLEGLKYIGTKLISSEDRADKIVLKVVFVFEDPKCIANDLALDFAKSRDRLYKNAWGFFRNEIEECRKSGAKTNGTPR